MGRPLTIVDGEGTTHGDGYVFDNGRVTLGTEISGDFFTIQSPNLEAAQTILRYQFPGLGIVDDHQINVVSNFQAFILEIEYDESVTPGTRSQAMKAIFALLRSNIEYDGGLRLNPDDEGDRMFVRSVGLICGNEMLSTDEEPHEPV